MLGESKPRDLGQPNAVTPTSAARAPERLVSWAGERGEITRVMREVCVTGGGMGVSQNATAYIKSQRRDRARSFPETPSGFVRQKLRAHVCAKAG